MAYMFVKKLKLHKNINNFVINIFVKKLKCPILTFYLSISVSQILINKKLKLLSLNK